MTYEKTPDGLNRDKAALDAAREALHGRGDGRISISDVCRRSPSTCPRSRPLAVEHMHRSLRSPISRNRRSTTAAAGLA
eukprot:scaffold12397_cov124-Isochrysis_galbana.AAC.3